MAMSAEEFKEALKKLELSQKQFGEEYGAGTRTVNRWASGEIPIPLSAQKFIKIQLVLREKDEKVS